MYACQKRMYPYPYLIFPLPPPLLSVIPTGAVRSTAQRRDLATEFNKPTDLSFSQKQESISLSFRAQEFTLSKAEGKGREGKGESCR